jgi:ASC-1-like (ASCH) protein
MIHKLKIDPQYLDNLISGRKKVEIRVNDRDYQLGDILEFIDYRDIELKYYRFDVTHIHSGLGMKENHVALSVKKIKGKLKS